MRPFYIFNTLSRSAEEFRPLNPPLVTYYSCGPTVYLPQHLGNMRAFLFVDTLKRALEFNGYRVRHVMNITDVGHLTSDADAGEDKVEKTAREQGRSPLDVANEYLALFKRDCEALNIELPTGDLLCRATDHIGEMLALIQRIIERGYAYVVPSGVYFDVERWRGGDRIGRLSRQSLDEQDTGQRLEHAADKRSPHDFALWVLNRPQHIMQWDSPWGRGYPGWHIECSAMAMKYLGETIDLHSGGIDHIAVHHENEIAQSEGATGKPFARYFVHNAFLVGKEGLKISKSTGSFPLLSDLVAAGIEPLAFRLLCFGAKYRSELALSDEALWGARRNLEYIYEFACGLRELAAADEPDAEWTGALRERFAQALNNDLNTPQALAVVLEMVAESYRRSDRRVWNTLKDFERVLGLRLESVMGQAAVEEHPAEIQVLIEAREEARRQGNFAGADSLRRELIGRGYEVKDQKKGPGIYRRRRL